MRPAAILFCALALGCRPGEDLADPAERPDEQTAAAAEHTMSGAMADGFRQFIPGGAAPVQHYTKLRWALKSRTRLDPSRPTSLLYRRAADGNLELVGAMFTAPAGATEDELDARLPLSVARWHQHMNWCTPRIGPGMRERWRETKDGHPVFGPHSPIATPEACEAVRGRFRPRLLGWMVHVMAFAGDDPHEIWGGGVEGGGHHH